MKNVNKYLALVLMMLGLGISSQVFGTNMVLEATGFYGKDYTPSGAANTNNTWSPYTSGGTWGTCTTTANYVTITGSQMTVNSNNFKVKNGSSFTVSVSTGRIYRIVFKGASGAGASLTESNGVLESTSDTWTCAASYWGFTKGKQSVTFTNNSGGDYQINSMNISTYREATSAEASISPASFTITAGSVASKSTTLTTSLGPFDGANQPYYNDIDNDYDELTFDHNMYSSTYNNGSTIRFDVLSDDVGTYTPAVILGRQTSSNTAINYHMVAIWMPFTVIVEDACTRNPTVAFTTSGTINKKINDSDFDNAATAKVGGVSTTQTISYESSDPTVATVNSSGRVHIVGYGSTTITASVESDGTNCAADASYTLNVTGYSVTFHYPACAESSPSNLTNQYGSVSLETNMAVDGYAFAGWTDHAVTSNPSSVSPLYTSSVTVSGNMDLYAVYSKTSSTFTLVDKVNSGTTSPEAGEYVIVSSYSQGSTSVMTAELDGTKGKLKTNSSDYSVTAVKTISCQEEACIWTIASVTGGFTVRNNSTGKYLSATSGATSSSDYKVRLDDETGDYTTWSISREEKKVPFTMTNKQRNTNSETNKNLMCNSSFFAFYGSGTHPYLFKRASSSGTYTSNPDCDAKEYTVTMQDADGGTASAAATGGTWSAPVLSGLHGTETVTITATPATGYSFTSWTVVSGSASLASSSTSPTTFTMPSSNVVIRPNFTPEQYNITYLDKGGTAFTGSPTPTPTTHTYGTATPLPSEFTKSGKEFMGWFTDINCTAGNQIASIGATAITADITLYAQWMSFSDYLAACPEPTLEVTGDVYVTSTQNKMVMAAAQLTVNATNLLASTGTIRLSTPEGSGVYFSLARNVNWAKADKPTATIDITADSGGDIYNQTVYVHYRPTATGTGAPQTIAVTATYQTLTSLTVSHDIYVRNMPSQFAIATKVGGNWYALPADMTTAGNPTGVALNVDESTWTAKGPSTLAYNLWPVKTVNQDANDYYQPMGEKLRFAGQSGYGLWANNSTTAYTIKVNAAADAMDNTHCYTDAYMWGVTTAAEGGTWKYTFTMAQTNNTNDLNYYLGKWGTYNASDRAMKDLYLIPLTIVEDAAMSVMEWGENEVAVKCAASTTLSKVTIDGTEISPVSLTQICGDIYKITGEGMPNLSTLATYAMKKMVVEVSESSTSKQFVTTIPFILTSANSPAAEPKTAVNLRSLAAGSSQDKKNDAIKGIDIVVRNGAQFDVTNDESTYCTFKDLYIYPGGKVHVNTLDLGAENVYMRGGFSWLEGASKDYRLPQMLVESGKTINGVGNSGNGVYYDLYLDNNMYYMTAFPKDVLLSAVTNEEGTADWTGWVKGYSGEGRTLNPKQSGWKYAWEISPGTTLYRGRGYEIAIKPRYKGAMNGRTIGILRFPLLQATAWSDEATPSISVTAWGYDAEAGKWKDDVTPNNRGWNYIGNPFFTAFKNTDENGQFGTNMEIRNLKEEIKDGKWTGKYVWVTDKQVKYITVPDKMVENYTDVKAKNYEIESFFPFFIQASATGTLTFTGSKILKAKALFPATVPAREVEIDFTLSDTNGKSDNAGLVVGNDYSPEFDMDDKEKTIVNENFLKIYTMVGEYRTAYNSLPEATAALPIPVGYIAPAEGKYTFALDDEDYSEVDHIWLTDYEKNVTVDLLDATDYAYEFETVKGTNNTRLALNIVLKPEEIDPVVTGMESVDGYGDEPVKFIHQDKMYILYHGVIYDATGKKVSEINK